MAERKLIDLPDGLVADSTATTQLGRVTKFDSTLEELPVKTPTLDQSAATKKYVDDNAGNVTTTVTSDNSDFIPRFQTNTPNLIQSNLVSPQNYTVFDTNYFYEDDPAIIPFQNYLDGQTHTSNIVISWDNANQQLMLSNVIAEFPITSIDDAGGGNVTLTTSDTSKAVVASTFDVAGTPTYDGNHTVISKTDATITFAFAFAGDEQGTWTPQPIPDFAYVTVRNVARVNGVTVNLNYGQYTLAVGDINKYLSADGNIDTNFNMVNDGDGYTDTAFSFRFDSESQEGLGFFARSSRQTDLKLNKKETMFFYRAG